MPKKQEGFNEEKRENEQKTICFGYGYRVISSKGKTQLNRTQKDKNEKVVSEASSPWSQDFLAFWILILRILWPPCHFVVLQFDLGK